MNIQESWLFERLGRKQAALEALEEENARLRELLERLTGEQAEE